jgi:hypothetical protein
MDSDHKDQSLFELIRIFREKISKFDPSKYGKSVEKAAELRKQGNEFFAKNQYEDAIQMYTDVRMFLTHFPVAVRLDLTVATNNKHSGQLFGETNANVIQPSGDISCSDPV